MLSNCKKRVAMHVEFLHLLSQNQTNLEFFAPLVMQEGAIRGQE